MKQKCIYVLKKLEEHGFIAFIVGGYVRDTLLHINTTDVDICTDATPNDIKNIFKEELKVIEDYGAIKLKLDKYIIDITTFRKELDYKNNKPIKIEYIHSLKEDLMRRDFTINTICFDSSFKVIDLLNGVKDLNNKLIKVVGDTKTKFDEDATRLIRSLRFMTIYNFKLDQDIINYFINYPNKFNNITYDLRIKELDKIFNSPNVLEFLTFIKKYNIDKYLGIRYNKVVNTNSSIGIWSQLEYNNNYIFSKKKQKDINSIKSLINKKDITKYDIYKYGLNITSIASLIISFPINTLKDMYNNLQIKNIKELNISYKDIYKYLKTNNYNKIIKVLEYEVVSDKIKNERDILIKRLKELIN